MTIDEWPDMQALFSEHDDQNGCWCMYWRVKRADFHRSYGEPLRLAMERVIRQGSVPGVSRVPRGWGRDVRPVGWVSVAPREEFPVLDRSRTLKRVDRELVWSITCFFVAAGYRRRGVSVALIEAAASYARSQGARIVEAYPIIPDAIKDPRYELYMGPFSSFEEAGFREVARRSQRRAIVRYRIPQGTDQDSSNGQAR